MRKIRTLTFAEPVFRPRFPFASAIAVAAGAAVPLAQASVFDWNNGGGGATGAALNWIPAAIPGAADDQRFDLGGTYTITHSASVPTSRTQQYLAGTITVSLGSPHTVTNGITVANSLADVATMRLTTGNLTSNAGVIVANASGTIGTITVDDDDADLLITGAGADLQVGVGGNGTLNITNVGRVVVADQFILGANNTSTSTALVSGFSVAPIGNSVLDVLGTSQSRIGAGGDSTMTVASGALANFGGDLVIANGSASTSSVTVQTAGLLHSRLTVAGDLLIARNTSAGAAAGNGTLTVNDGGDVTVGGTTFVGGDPDGGTAALNVRVGANLTTHSLIVGDTGATFSHTGGIVTVDGGTFDPAGTSLLVNSTTGDSPLLSLKGGATCSLSSPFTALNVGSTGKGELELDDSGTQLTVTSGAAIVGSAAGSEGYIRLFGGSVDLDLSRTFLIGLQGLGRVFVYTGATFDSGQTFQGTTATGYGTANVQYSGALWTIHGDAAAGGDNVAVGGGTGFFSAKDHGRFAITGDLYIWTPGGAIEASSDGEIAADGDVNIDGFLFMDGGTIRGRHVRINNGATTVHGSFLGDVTIFAGSTITADGDITLGQPTGNFGFINNGTLNAGAALVTILDGDAAHIGNATVNGGTILAPDPDGLVLAAGKTISGVGTIDAAIANSGTILATGTGLEVDGIITGIGQGVSGTHFTFDNGGGFTGAGGLHARIGGGQTAIITATGTLTLGDAASSNGFAYLGHLIVGPHAVTLEDSSVASMGVRTSLNGGGVFSPSGLTTYSAPVTSIEGHGAITTPSFSCNGGIAPGAAGTPAGIGTIGIFGSLSIGSLNGGVDVDLAGSGAPGTCDRVTVSGTCSLHGALTVARLNSFHPLTPTTIIILSAASISGTFDSTAVPPGYSVVYTPTTVGIKVCPGDHNGIGGVTVQDIYDFLAAWNAGDPIADFNGSLRVTVQDIYDFLGAWNAGCP